MERVRAALRSEAVDRPPYSFWTHFPGVDLDPEQLARTTLAFARELDLDFVKAMPNGQFCTEDWGVVSDFSEVAKGGVARVVRPAIREPGDWRAIGRLDVSQGAFGRELEQLGALCNAIGKETPILATAFSPLTVAQKLAGALDYRTHLQSDPQAVLQALDAIAATMADYVREALRRGCAGVFFATQESSFARMDMPSYQRFGQPGDLEVLAAAQPGWFNAIHMHGDSVMFDLLSSYPVTALNWHIGETPPLLREYAARDARKPVLGGLQRMALTQGALATLEADIGDAMHATGGRGLLFGPGCVIRHPVDRKVLQRVIEMIRNAAHG